MRADPTSPRGSARLARARVRRVGSAVRPMRAPMIALALALCAAPLTSRAQSPALRGWALDRFEPSPAGDVFFVAEHPWYSSARYLAAGIVLDHAIAPLSLRREYADGTTREDGVVSGMLVGHVLVAGSFLDRVGVHASLPVSLLQSGTPDPTMATRLAPAGSPAVGDLRLGVRVRILGRSDTTPFSLHLGAVLWAPTGSRDLNTGDGATRFEPRVALAGRVGPVRWAFGAGFALRPEFDTANVMGGNELRLTAGVGAALLRDALHLGAECAVRTVVRSLPTAMGGGTSAFARDAWGGEVLFGARYTVARQVALGLAGGFGFEQSGGTPAGRLVFSAQWAPLSAPAASR